MSTDSRLPRKFSQGPIGFLADPTCYVVRIYPETAYPGEIVFVPLLHNGQEAGRWQGRYLTQEQYQQLVEAIRGVIAPAPVCQVRELPTGSQLSTASTVHPGATPESEVS